MGTIIFFIGFVAMVASFTIALIQYNKLQRMDLTVMCFMISLAVMVGGVTASVLDGTFRKAETVTSAEEKAKAEEEAKKAQEPPPTMYVSWDESRYSGGASEDTSASGEAAEPSEGEQSEAEASEGAPEGERPPAEQSAEAPEGAPEGEQPQP